MFDTEYQETIKATDIKLIDESKIILEPRGGTALFDAIGKTINSIGARLSLLPENERPNKVVVITATDGDNNSSVEFTRSQIKKMTETQQKDYNWQFIYLGANQDSFTEAQSFGVNSGSTVNYAPNAKSIGTVFRSLSKNLTSYSLGTKVNMDFEPEDYKAQEDLNVTQK